MDQVENDSPFLWERAFAGNMARLRVAQGTSQNELAKRLTARGLPFYQATVQRVENGDRSIRLDEACLIAEYFEVSLDAMMTNFSGPMEDASYAVDRVRRYAKTLVDNGQEDVGEFVNELDSLCLAFEELRAASEGKATPELAWLAAWIIKCGWLIESWREVEMFANGLHNKGEDWHQARVLGENGWDGLSWVQEEDAELWEALPERDRPLFLADLDPLDLHRWINKHSHGER